MQTILDDIRKSLKSASDEKAKQSFPKYFKEKVSFYGVRSAKVAEIAKNNFKKIKNESKEVIFSLCEELLKSGFCEEAFIAANWSYWIHGKFEENDIKVFERWIEKYIDNWAECDTLCNHTVGAYVEKYPASVELLKTWSKSKNRWMKRAAAVSLVIPARKGDFLDDIFEIAETLLTDTDDMVQKGYGWMLKEASRKHQGEVFDFVVKYKKDMPRTALRYAIEKMPKALKQKAMSKD